MPLPSTPLRKANHDMNEPTSSLRGTRNNQTTASPTMDSTKRVSIEVEPVERILAGGPNSPKMPAPVEHVGSPKANPKRVSYQEPASPRKSTSHARSMSSIDGVVRRNNRLSLSFPVQPSTMLPPPIPSPTQSFASPIATSAISLSTSPTDNDFLTALAAQERYVLEVKEELHRAEQDLEQLKREWATHQATTKRQDVRRSQQLQPLNTSLLNLSTPDADDGDGSSLWMQREMEMRKALLSGKPTSQRRVFSGSHTRTLSLLSPDKATYTPSFRQPDDVRKSQDKPERPAPPIRPATTPDVSGEEILFSEDNPNGDIIVTREALLRTGKQMAADFKDGLWTFIEDIRQATVGEEGINGTQSRTTNMATPMKKKGSKASLKQTGGANGMRRASSTNNVPKSMRADDSTLIDIGGSFWKEHGLDEPTSKPAATKAKAKKASMQPKPVPDVEEDSWDTWDTPKEDKRIHHQSHPSASTATTDTGGRTSPDSDASSQRTSISSNGISTPITPASNKRTSMGSIPWPDLVKLTPSHLKRTASHLMNEWEKSLSPPAEEKSSNDYVSRSPSGDVRSGKAD